ncbi:hypothetical protein AAFF_G00039620 [Aldrovandia affinis]|uniref:Uncharacterized protein n=1 Tax=Aldrovandia affinis TaxID=143900 RepID=A0AAD7S2Z3_9TELE|nr:hypothetical protein AAFF_G00039620 [Aldrovandia affinis]
MLPPGRLSKFPAQRDCRCSVPPPRLRGDPRGSTAAGPALCASGALFRCAVGGMGSEGEKKGCLFPGPCGALLVVEGDGSKVGHSASTPPKRPDPLPPPSLGVDGRGCVIQSLDKFGGCAQRVGSLNVKPPRLMPLSSHTRPACWPRRDEKEATPC